ncbi:hypothetical protein ACLK1S_26360 [Escherichia coli]
MASRGNKRAVKRAMARSGILDIIPETLHQRRSFFVGNDHMVEDVERLSVNSRTCNLLCLSTRRVSLIAAVDRLCHCEL